MEGTYPDETRRAERHAYYEAHRTEPDFWIRKAEGALAWGVPENVAGYLALARYYRDGEAT